MADVLVKGVKMPKRCYDCPFCETEGYITCLCTPDWKDIGKMTWIKRRPSWCPLVEVPEHGRLIDADKLLPESGYDPEMFKNKYPIDAGYKQFQTLMGYEIYNMVENAPTVLEASK